MGRHRVYSSAAERQRAYRLRVRLRLAQSTPSRGEVPTLRRPPSRPKRLAALQAEAQRLQDEYETWLDALPEPLQSTGAADRVRDAVDQLAAVTELLSGMVPPRGFGRD